jgi:hypothetical protein
MCHWFRLMNRDGYFWFNFDPFKLSIVLHVEAAEAVVNRLEPEMEPPSANLTFSNPSNAQYEFEQQGNVKA